MVVRTSGVPKSGNEQLDRFTMEHLPKAFPSKCWWCGKEIMREVEPCQRIYCIECEKKKKEEYASIIHEYLHLKKKIMLERGVKILENATLYMDEYYLPYKNIRDEFLEGKQDFLSSEEIAVALVLVNLGYDYIPNYKILNHKVDFYIPEIKVCLEIDGVHHEMTTIKDSRRDKEIRDELGADWEIVRIKTEYIHKNPEKVIDACIALKEEKQKLRKANGGFLPEYFSDREKDMYERMEKRKLYKK